MYDIRKYVSIRHTEEARVLAGSTSPRMARIFTVYNTSGKRQREKFPSRTEPLSPTVVPRCLPTVAVTHEVSVEYG